MSSQSNSYKGVWWLPTDPNTRVYGELTLSENNEANLELQGYLPIPLQDEPNTKLKTYIILGLSQTGEKITIAEGYPTLSRLPMALPNFPHTSLI